MSTRWLSVPPGTTGTQPAMSDLPHQAEVDQPGIRAVARDKDQGLLFVGSASDLVVVEERGLGIDAVGTVSEQLAGDVGPEPVGEMPSGLQRHPEERLVAQV